MAIGADKQCSIAGCDKPKIARGWCSKHWTRWQRHGSPTARLRGEVVDGRRICATCKVDTPLSEYSPQATSCKTCNAAKRRQRVAANPELRQWHREYSRRYNAENAERLREMARAWRQSNPEGRRKQSAARRAVIRGAVVEDFLPVDVFERDQWQCHLCGEPVDRDAKWPHPLSASLDHLIPLSRGGEHSMQNTACSHLRCNQRKYNKMPSATKAV